MDCYSKFDLHIHSFASSLTKTGDQKIVTDSKIENLQVLVDKLIENQVNVVAITDHNIFDKEIYEQLKKHETQDDCIYKVLPGLELDLQIETKNVHVVCIFDDSHPDHAVKIHEGFVVKEHYSIDDLGSILRKIELGVVLIVHQKCDYKSEKPQKTSLSSAGEQVFLKFLGCEFFDSLEIQNSKVEGILKNRFSEDGINLEDIHLVVGSDCHEWSSYPAHHSGQRPVELLYMKALPSFQGLVMAVTDYSRIFKNPEPQKENALNEIKISFNGNQRGIALSDKINVIIGDNSVGKSTLIKYLCNEASKGSIDFLKDHGVEIITNPLGKTMYSFSAQGQIREMFEMTEEKLPIKQRFAEYFKPIDKAKFNKIIKDILRYYSLIWSKNEKISNNAQNLNKTIFIPCFTVDEKHYLSIDLNLELINNNYTSLVKIFVEFNSKFKEFNECLALLESEDIAKLKQIRDELLNLGKKYNAKEKNIEIQREIQNVFSYCSTVFNEEMIKKTNSDELSLNTFMSESQKAIKSICDDLEFRFTKIKSVWETFETFKVNTSINQIGKYCFIDKPTTEIEINKELIEGFIAKFINIEKPLEDLTTSEILASIKSKRIQEKTADNLNQLLNILYTQFTDTYFSTTVEIKRGDDKLHESNSAGINALYYIDILSETFNKSIFIIDQPEDDVSQSRISSDLIPSLKCLAQKAQIILVTHNPQLVVNLDADNVIILKKSENEIDFYAGALEYKDENYSILDLVARTLDGGTDVIRKRWKRYAKSSL